MSRYSLWNLSAGKVHREGVQGGTGRCYGDEVGLGVVDARRGSHWSQGVDGEDPTREENLIFKKMGGRGGRF